MKIKLLVFLIFISYALKGFSLNQEYVPMVKNIIDIFKLNNADKIANLIDYPFERDFPIPSIKNKNEMKTRFNEVFDDSIINAISNSNAEKNWELVGQRGIMLDNGQVWINESGKIKSIKYRTESENEIRRTIVKKDKIKIHQSIDTYLEPVVIFKTKHYLVRIDKMLPEKYRYVSWAVGKNQHDKPDLVLENGNVTFNGSGGNHFYTFINGMYRYEYHVNFTGSEDTPPKDLEVFKEENRILYEPFVKVLEMLEE